MIPCSLTMSYIIFNYRVVIETPRESERVSYRVVIETPRESERVSNRANGA